MNQLEYFNELNRHNFPVPGMKNTTGDVPETFERPKMNIKDDMFEEEDDLFGVESEETPDQKSEREYLEQFDKG